MKNFHLLCLAAIATGCNLGGSVAMPDPAKPLTEQPDDGSGDGDITPERTAAAVSAYYEGVCRLYVEPTCTAQAKATCSPGLAVDDQAACTTWMAKATERCDGAAEALAELTLQLEACTAHVAAASCDDPLCGSDGVKVDRTGPCAEVATVIAELCPEDKDTGS